MTKKTVVGYFYRKSSETPLEALEHYTEDLRPGLHKTLKEAQDMFELDVNNEIVGKTTKPKFMRVVLEEMGEKNE